MTIERLDSADDSRLVPYQNLKATNATRRTSEFVVEGLKLVERLLRSRYPAVSIVLGRRWLARLDFAIPESVPILVVPDAMLPALVGFNFHQGALACGLRLPDPQVDDVVGTKETALVVACPQLYNPENLGQIARISRGLGVDLLLIGADGADPFSRRALRVSMGELLHLPIVCTADMNSELARLRDRHRFELLAAVLDPRAEPLEQVRPAGRTVLVLGSEAHGLAAETVALCQRKVTIAMQSGTDSLNVAVAAGIMLYQLSRAREH
jgi:tRNA G18 (ribose-2'-O)-methylase SpoU